MKDYIVVPLGEILNKGYDETKIETAFKKFSCHREEDLENFLMQKSITYEKADIGKTYLCVDKEDLEEGNFSIIAYFTLAQKQLGHGERPCSFCVITDRECDAWQVTEL